MKYRQLAVFAAVQSVVAIGAFACGTPADGGPLSGSGGSGSGGAAGATASGGAPASGGAVSGGASSGGASSGGASNGGASNGGASSGGASNGGATSGGAMAGGAMSGGKGGTNGGSASGGTAGTNGGTASGGSGGASTGGLPKFSFFVTSYAALQVLAGTKDGFGGDLRFGETGDGAGLRGADKICTTIAEKSMPGSSVKVWRAFLSAPATATTPVVNARDRIGAGPWYDRQGRVVGTSLTGLFSNSNKRPDADPIIMNDLPNEDGIPNHNPDNTGAVDNHDILTGSDEQGNLYAKGTNPTCSGWTTKEGKAGKPRCGHSWPREKSTQSWASYLDEAGCGAGVNLIEMGPPDASVPTVGSGGGYGGIYCFAMAP